MHIARKIKRLNWRDCAGLALVLGLTGVAQGFDLLDPERGKEKLPASETPTAAPAAPAPPQPAKPPPQQQDFALRGTSRIGGRFAATLETPEGKTLAQEFRDAKPTPLGGGFGEYSLIEVSPRHATLSYPEDAPCRNSNPQRGLRCSDDGKTARLELVRGKPSAPPPVMAAPPPPMPVPMAAGNLPPQPSRAAFAAPVPGQPMPAATTKRPPTPQIMEYAKQEQQRAASQPATANPAASNGIKPPGSIRDEDVPPGMRVVRTPFGDTLVPQNQ